MRAVRLGREGATQGALAGRVLCHDVRDSQGVVALDKGRLLSPAYSRLDRARVERLRDRSRGRSVLADKGA